MCLESLLSPSEFAEENRCLCNSDGCFPCCRCCCRDGDIKACIIISWFRCCFECSRARQPKPQLARAMLPMAPVTKPPQLLLRDLSGRPPQLQLGGSGTTLGDVRRDPSPHSAIDPSAESTFAVLGDVWPSAARRQREATAKQTRALRATSLAAALPAFASDSGAVVAGTSAVRRSSAGECTAQKVVPTLRDEMIYDLVGTTFGVCKICFANEKEIKLNPCGHMCCRKCKEVFDTKFELHREKLPLDAISPGGNGICPFCKVGVDSIGRIEIDNSHLVAAGAAAVPTKSGGVMVRQHTTTMMLPPAQPTPAAEEYTYPPPSHWEWGAKGNLFSSKKCSVNPSIDDQLLEVKVVRVSLLSTEGTELVAKFLSSAGDVNAKSVTVTGIKRIQNMALWQAYSVARKLMRARRTSSPTKSGKKCYSSATWQFQADNGTWASYTDVQSATLERALKAKKHTVDFQIGHHKYTVAFRPSDPFAGTDTYVPVDWNTSLHKPVQTNIATLKERAIRRWAPYSAEFEALDRKGDSDGCEQSCLFHGTTQSATKQICQQGFNRSFCGTSNGNRYGQGVYFSRTAKYSMDSKYSRCDAYGIQRVFMCRVLTGESCLGRSGQLVPDVYDRATGRLHDTTVDQLPNPDIYVTYQDAQAFPEYLIEFDMRSKCNA